MSVCGIHHVGILVSDTEQALVFYHELLGIPLAERPGLGFPGVWLQIGEQQIHLLELSNPDPVAERPEHVGRDRHLALRIDDLDGLVERLQSRDIPFTRSRSGRNALFCRDPDGNGVELIQSG